MKRKIEYKEYPRTAEAARKAGVMYYDTHHACQAGHFSLRRVSDGACVRCLRIEEVEQDLTRGE